MSLIKNGRRMLQRQGNAADPLDHQDVTFQVAMGEVESRN
jgi:hypothetical protein